jgi:uncharacterized membrane protein YtjA (UPF0391 family)
LSGFSIINPLKGVAQFLHQSLYFSSFKKTYVMLRRSVIFLIIAIIAAIFGFGGLAIGIAEIARVFFFVFIVLFFFSLVQEERKTE